ncbi:radical SAM family heme chaperone HemW [Thalassococcus lentus]|uniref:Heme chaperone HemW n=1 Tax=Thalassococcus lentus TaxID=1210524 RepID=A0ABT4XNC2_9RHOB|nr:radical SAM family heme chaperone HemW [Thalassococcus lentus]MDA7423407.1 radical SAM family heme chaperone HemW [Thalassococcus lentus]
MADDWKAGGFALYVHWPFCESKCPYCDFNSHVSQFVDQQRWARALVSEIDRYSELTKGRVLRSIFFGGGTPSLMAVETVQSVLEASKKNWLWANDIEITLEANPGSVETAKFQGFSEVGVNRVSLGIQALNDTDLKRLGRLHSVAEAKTAFDTARKFFDRVSFDLIYARQDQSLADWRSELTEALSMAGDHLSLYQLTIEPGTAFWDRAQRGGLRGLPEDSLSADMYDLTQELCDQAGYSAYEVSNHAQNGSESRHNLVYWNYGDYIGVGPGAHGRVTKNGQKYATEAISAPGAWIKAAELGNADVLSAVISPPDMAGEAIMMGLRTIYGLDVDRVRQIHPDALPSAKLSELQDLNLIELDGGRIKPTRQGTLLLNSVITELLPEPV